MKGQSSMQKKFTENSTAADSNVKISVNNSGKNEVRKQQLVKEEEALIDEKFAWPANKKFNSPPKKSKLRKRFIKPSGNLSPNKLLDAVPAPS